ncbi:helix-turn-helix domain-containing protein [Lachnospiraceae bacterium MD329]|nr:helix-turn-helix domain-containing protein [Lachnospiraceae bacterium MD329]
MNKYISPDFETIRKANVGDSEAMQKLLAHYNAYIQFFATYNGVVNYVYAEEIRARLMKAVLKFDIDR